MEFSDKEIDFRFRPIARDFEQYDRQIKDFDLALLDDRVSRAAAHLLDDSVEKPPFDFEDLMRMIQAEYLLDKSEAVDVFQIVEDRLYKRAL